MRPAAPRLTLALVAILAAGPAAAQSAPDAALPNILLSDNDVEAGTLADGVLTVRLEARDGVWYANGSEGIVRHVAAFGEEGQPIRNPGPLLRAPAGTEVRVHVRNHLAVPLTMFGLGERRGLAGDSFAIEPGGAREMRFIPGDPGIYWYAGKTTERPVLARGEQDSQLHGLIVVDPPGAPRPANERFFMISWYGRSDSTSVSGLSPDSEMMINGRSWPHTERFEVTQGDSLNWRWVNMIIIPHPMHLHGFYFRVDAKGDGVEHTRYAPEERRHAVTEFLLPGAAVELAWSPTRPGNWIFHCHFAGHMSTMDALNKDRRMPPMDEHGTHGAHAQAQADAQTHAPEAASEHVHQMAGLVIGIRVKPRADALAVAPPADERALRLVIRSRASVYGDYVGYSYLLGGSAEESDPDAMPIPGPTLVLEKDRPVAITVVNRSHEPAAVHWHGIELESFPDGVPGWSGYGDQVLPAIGAGDSLTVRFTPPRAGTFMYHSHFNEFQQLSSGLYGPLLVLEPGQRHDPERDRVLLFSDEGPTVKVRQPPLPEALLNGQARPEPIRLRAGETYRFRLISIRSNNGVHLRLLDPADGEPAEWRLVAKDGFDLPPHQAVVVPAVLTFGAGEIVDVEFTPRTTGEYRLEFGLPARNPSAGPPRVATVRVGL